MSAERLQKIISAAGLASRRQAEAWILEGRVSVNGQVVHELGTKAQSCLYRGSIQPPPPVDGGTKHP